MMNMLVAWFSRLLLWLGQEGPAPSLSAEGGARGFAAALASYLSEAEDPLQVGSPEGDGVRQKAAPAVEMGTALIASLVPVPAERQALEPQPGPVEDGADPRQSEPAPSTGEGRTISPPVARVPGWGVRTFETVDALEGAEPPAGRSEVPPRRERLSQVPAAPPAAVPVQVTPAAAAPASPAEDLPASEAVEAPAVPVPKHPERRARPAPSQAESVQTGGGQAKAAKPARGAASGRSAGAPAEAKPSAASPTGVAQPDAGAKPAALRPSRGPSGGGARAAVREATSAPEGFRRAERGAPLGPGPRRPIAEPHIRMAPGVTAGGEAETAAAEPRSRVAEAEVIREVASGGQPPAAPDRPRAAPIAAADPLAEAPENAIPSPVRQAQRALQRMAARGQDGLRLRLEPEHLGVIDLAITRREEGLHVLLTADRPETGALLHRHLPALRQALAEIGVNLAGLSVGRQGTNHGPGEGRGQAWSGSATPVLGPQEGEAQVTGFVEARSPEGTVDYRI